MSYVTNPIVLAAGDNSIEQVSCVVLHERIPILGSLTKGSCIGRAHNID
jgi:hypothetical protein